MRAAKALAALAFTAALTTGCGSDDPPDPDPRPVETAEKSPKLPDGWTRHANEDGGFELGLPRGWKAVDRGTTTRVTSFDQLVVLSIAADRTNEAIEYDLEEFASATIAALQGYEKELAGKAKRYKHRYDGATVEVDGVKAKGGGKQDVAVIILRRPKLALFTIIEQANASAESDPAKELAAEVIATLRSRPIT